jgi:transposase
MKAIHDGKAKNDPIDSQKIAVLLRGGMIPVAYVYPPQMRSTRDLLRRRTYLMMRKRAELLAHVQHTNSQYNLPEIGKKIAYKANRSGVVERFSDPAVQTSIVRQIAAFLGLVSSEHSTGEQVHRGSITRTGDVRLRNKLVETAWTTIRIDPEFREFYQRIHEKHPQPLAARKAIVAVARKLTTRIYSV